MKKSRLLGAVCAFVFLSFNAEAALVATGPDAFGHTGTSISNNLRDISASGTFLSLSDDQTSAAINIGFGFDFYGASYTDTYVSSNGFMGFTAGMSNGCCSGQPLPAADGIDNLIAGLWEDLNYSPGNIRYQTLGVAGSREFVVGFYNNPHFADGPQVTFEMILHEGSNNIEFQYGAITSNGGTHTVGIENATGTDGLQVLYSSVLDFSNTGYLITTSAVPVPAAAWLFGSGLLGLVGISRRKKAA